LKFILYLLLFYLYNNTHSITIDNPIIKVINYWIGTCCFWLVPRVGCRAILIRHDCPGPDKLAGAKFAAKGRTCV